jgi:hypothetical protein
MIWLKRLLFVVAVLITVAALVLVFESWRGRRAWLKFKAELEGKGERLDIAAFIPRPIPDAENFAMTPFFAPLLKYHHTGDPPVIVWHDSNGLSRAQNTTLSGVKEGNWPPFGARDKTTLTDLQAWQEYYHSNRNFSLPEQRRSPGADVLQALSRYEAVFAELHEAAKRPHAAFPIHYDESFYAMLPHLAVLKSVSNLVRLRTLALLAENRPEEALADIQLNLRLAESIKTEPLLISQLVRIAIVQITADSVWEGLSARRWNDQQVAQLQSAFSSIQLLHDFHFAMCGERAFGNDVFEKMRAGHKLPSEDIGLPRYAPSGLLYHNQLVINRIHEKYSFNMVDGEKRRVYVDRAHLSEDPPELRTRHPYHILARILFPALAKACGRFALAQSTVDQTALACALERYRLAHGEYPETLKVLTPQFVREVPHDVITGEALRYSRIDKDKFVLYSVGWNEKDDAGVPAPRAGGATAKTGDWVWTPAPPRDN